MTDPKLIALPGGKDAPLDERDDDALMLLASAGRTDAFAVLVARYVKRLSNLCAKLVCDARVGEELAQESWLQVWAARGKYQPGGRFTVYLFTVARNRCRNHLRDGKRRARWLESDLAIDQLPDGAAPGQLDALLDAERRRRVSLAIATLPDTLREVVLFRFSEGLDYPDIARIVGRTESAIRSRVYLAMAQLREQLGQGGEP